MGVGIFKEIRFVVGKIVLFLLESILESQTGKIQGRSLQGGVFTVESCVHARQWSCWFQHCSYRVRKIWSQSSFCSLYLLLHSSEPGAEKWSSTALVFNQIVQREDLWYSCYMGQFSRMNIISLSCRIAQSLCWGLSDLQLGAYFKV